MVRRPQTLIVAMTVAGLTACTPVIQYPPPAQKTMPTGEEPLLGRSMAHMGDPSTDTAIIQDVLGGQPGSSWRWTNQHPRVKVCFHPGRPTTFYLRFTLAGVVLKQTGPMTIRMLVNGRELDTRTFAKEQEYGYSKVVPQAMLGSGDEAIIGLDIDPVYVSPGDGVKLGVLLQDFGFKQAGVE